MLKVSFLEAAEQRSFKYAVIVARHKGRWVFCRHQKRQTLECPGGHWEPGETIDQTAERELLEETGALTYSIYPVCIYSVTDALEETFGMLYFAEIHGFGDLPPLEIEERILLEALPEESKWTYPKIQPLLVERVKQHPAFQ